MSTRAVVLGGGGVAGIGWLVGVATVLRDEGVDLAAADRLIGTSAGSAVATQIATGSLDEAARMQLSEQTAEINADFDMEEFLRLATTIAAEASSPLDAVRRFANMPRQDTSVTAGERREAVAARLPVKTWPDQPLSICVVAQDTGERVILDRASGVDLVDAVVASCAVPGIWPPVELDGRMFVDGGTHSTTNADLAAGTDKALILVPSVLLEPQAAVLDVERGQLAPGTSLVVQADEGSIAAFGPNPLDPSTRAPAFHAGQRQAQQSLAAVAAFWGA